MEATPVFDGSNGDITKLYYEQLSERGPIGLVAMNLFRAQKCSERAKVYRGGIRGKGRYKDMAYDRKAWSLANLCDILGEHGDKLGIVYGWKQDAGVQFDGRPSWVFYVEIPTGQVSFHSPTRGKGPAYLSNWDGIGDSRNRILKFCDHVFKNEAVQTKEKVEFVNPIASSLPPLRESRPDPNCEHPPWD